MTKEPWLIVGRSLSDFRPPSDECRLVKADLHEQLLLAAMRLLSSQTY